MKHNWGMCQGLLTYVLLIDCVELLLWMYMCGRYSIAVELGDLESRFGAKFGGTYAPRYNAAPSQDLPVILNESPDQIVPVRWGLKPPWMHSIRRDGLINVRSDTLKERATFRKDLLLRRCLVLADGFYEWRRVGSRLKIPFRFVRKDGSPFAFAGIWEVNRDEKERDLKAFSIVTTDAKAPVARIHDRMPVILKKEDETEWLSAKTQLPELWDLMDHPDARSLSAYEVSRAVNNARNDSRELILPVDSSAEEAAA